MEFQDWTSVEAHHKDQKALPENFEPLEPLEIDEGILFVADDSQRARWVLQIFPRARFMASNPATPDEFPGLYPAW